MKQGKSIEELAKEIQRQQDNKKDFIVPVHSMKMNQDGMMDIDSEEIELPLDFTKHAHNQLSDYVGVPRKYYDRMRTEGHADLLAHNVNRWLTEKPNDKKLIRTLDGDGRAFLSNRYRRLDNLDLMEAVLPTLLESGKANIASSDVTSNKLYLKALFPSIEGEVKKGDVVQAGIVVSNSEVGAGGVNVQPLIMRLVCLNGMICPDSSIKKYHIGRNSGMGDTVQELLTDDTKRQTDLAFWMSVKDVVKASFNDVFFKTQLEKLQVAAGLVIVSKKLDKVVQLATKKFGFSDGIGESVLDKLIRGADLTKWGLANAFTAAANDQEDYEDATALESVGGQIIELNPTDWKVLSEVA